MISPALNLDQKVLNESLPKLANSDLIEGLIDGTVACFNRNDVLLATGIAVRLFGKSGVTQWELKGVWPQAEEWLLASRELDPSNPFDENVARAIRLQRMDPDNRQVIFKSGEKVFLVGSTTTAEDLHKQYAVPGNSHDLRAARADFRALFGEDFVRRRELRQFFTDGEIFPVRVEPYGTVELSYHIQPMNEVYLAASAEGLPWEILRDIAKFAAQHISAGNPSSFAYRGELCDTAGGRHDHRHLLDRPQSRYLLVLATDGETRMPLPQTSLFSE